MIKIIDSVDVAREVLKNVVQSNNESSSNELYSDVVSLSEFLGPKRSDIRLIQQDLF